MPKYDLPFDQSSYQIRIGIERSPSEMARNFFIPGEARLGLPRVTIGQFCELLETPAQFLAGDNVPLIYVRRGVVHFGCARWGDSDQAGGVTSVQQLDCRSIGYPALIPASFIDLAIEPTDSRELRAVRLRSESGNLYLGCTFKNDSLGNAQTVTPLVCPARTDIVHHIKWQPVLIPIGGPPSAEHFDFLLRRHGGRFRVPSTPRSIKAEIISLMAGTDVC